MSRFSTINAQHSASRDLERQRLERMMGQLRREVESATVEPGSKGASERRFKPATRRRQPPPRCASDLSHHSARSNGGTTDESCQPGPGTELGGERAPSAEIAWLWRMNSRMEEDAEQVAAFLTRNGLDRYVALLSEDPQGLGDSLDALLEADDESLAKLGLPASPRGRLLAALEAERAERARGAAPRVSADSPPATASQKTQLKPAAPERKWGSLGHVPSGWHRTAPSAKGKARVVETVTTGCGGDDALPEEALHDIVTAAPQVIEAPLVIEPQALTPKAPSAGSRPSSRLSSRPGSRPGSALKLDSSSRPGTGSAREDKVCCYECFKQIVPKFALNVEDPSQGDSKQFCSEACIERFNKALAARSERGRQLRELRASVLDGDREDDAR